MGQIKRIFFLIVAGLMMIAACDARKVEGEIYQNGAEGAADDAAAADRAETTVAVPDSTAVIISIDSVRKAKRKL